LWLRQQMMESFAILSSFFSGDEGAVFTGRIGFYKQDMYSEGFGNDPE